MKAEDQIFWRDRLYALMAQSLEEPEQAALFDFLGAQAGLYRFALKEWAARPKPKDPLAQALAFAEVLFNHRLFFATHEYLESFWKAAQGETKSALQGLIQIAAGFHKLELDPDASSGALELIEKGVRNLESSGSTLGQGTVELIKKKLEPAATALHAGRSADLKAPSLFWTES